MLRIPSFRDFDFDNLTELNVEQQESNFNAFPHENLKVIVVPTASQDHENLEDFHFSSSSVNVQRNYQISFQADFMEEHENAFKNQTENFIESSFKFCGNKNITFQSYQIFGEGLQFGVFSEDEESLQRFQENVQFIKNIQKQEKLIKYLEFIYKSAPKELAAQFIYLASIAWERHSSNKDIQISEIQISQKVKQLVEEESNNLFQDQRIKFLNFRVVSTSQLNSEVLVKHAFKQYLQFFFTTIILVGEEYFENPYGEIVSAKRQRTFKLEDEFDENEPSSTNSINFGRPSKKLHFY